MVGREEAVATREHFQAMQKILPFDGSKLSRKLGPSLDAPKDRNRIERILRNSEKSLLQKLQTSRTA